MTLRSYRNRQRLTLQQLAWRSELSEGYLSMLENGKRKNPSLQTLRKLAKALKMTVNELVD